MTSRGAIAIATIACSVAAIAEIPQRFDFLIS
jgi:hypothetical protein